MMFIEVLTTVLLVSGCNDGESDNKRKHEVERHHFGTICGLYRLTFIPELVETPHPVLSLTKNHKIIAAKQRAEQQSRATSQARTSLLFFSNISWLAGVELNTDSIATCK